MKGDGVVTSESPRASRLGRVRIFIVAKHVRCWWETARAAPGAPPSPARAQAVSHT
jgi:hypothetical protein